MKIKFKTSENVEKYSNSILCIINCTFAEDRSEYIKPDVTGI